MSSSGPWFRFHRTIRDPLHFGSVGINRFDAPGDQYRILYLGQDAHCAFIETYGQSLGINVVTVRSVAERSLTRIEAARPLVLVDLTANGLARLGADERLCSGEHAIAQQWALALWGHPSYPDGLLYRARHDPSRSCVAIFDRAGEALRAVRQGTLLEPDQVSLLADILDTYAFGLL